MFKSLEGYEPKEPADNEGFEPLSGVFTCIVNFARLEEDDGQRFPDRLGHHIFKYELEIADHAQHSGRRFFGFFDLDDEEKVNKKGETKAQQLANIMFKCGIDLGTTEESVNACAEKFCSLILEVSARHFKGSDGKEVQLHTIRGINTMKNVDGSATTGSSPF